MPADERNRVCIRHHGLPIFRGWTRGPCEDGRAATLMALYQVAYRYSAERSVAIAEQITATRDLVAFARRFIEEPPKASPPALSEQLIERDDKGEMTRIVTRKLPDESSPVALEQPASARRAAQSVEQERNEMMFWVAKPPKFLSWAMGPREAGQLTMMALYEVAYHFSPAASDALSRQLLDVGAPEAVALQLRGPRIVVTA